MPSPDFLTLPERAEAARLAHMLLRCAMTAAHPFASYTPPGVPKVGSEAFVFTPSWIHIPVADVDLFLAGLDSPALLSPTLTKGVVALTLVHELTGDRRRWAEKTLSNQADALETSCAQLGFGDSTSVLVEFDEEREVFRMAAVRHWARYLAVDIGWAVHPLTGEPNAEACLKLLRADGHPFPGRSSMLHAGFRRSAGDAA